MVLFITMLVTIITILWPYSMLMDLFVTMLVTIITILYDLTIEIYSLDSENLVLTAGATHGLHLLASLFLRTGTPIFVEDPTYFLAFTMLRDDFGMNIVPGVYEGWHYLIMWVDTHMPHQNA